MRTTTPPSIPGYFLFWAGADETQFAVVSVYQGRGLWWQRFFGIEPALPLQGFVGTWEGPLQPQREPDLAAMKRAFVEAWPRAHITDMHGQAIELPDEPFLMALQAAWREP